MKTISLFCQYRRTLFPVRKEKGRNIYMRTRPNCILIRLLIGTVITLVAGNTWAQTSAGKLWRVKHDSGIEALEKGARVTITLSSDAIKGLPQKGEAFTIPVSATTGVSYDNIEKRRTKTGAALMVASPLGGLLVMVPKSARKYLTIISH
jgi:hypothetical protein